MMKRLLQSAVILGLTVCALTVGWGANIALLIDEGNILAGDDPVHDPEAKQFTIETLVENGDAGLVWLINHLEKDLGHTVNIYGSNTDDPAQVEKDNDLIFISEELGSGSVAGDYRIAAKPVVFAEAYLLDDMGFTNNQSAFTGDSIATEIKIVNPNHPITRGLPETFTATIPDKTTGKPIIPTFSTVTDTAILVEGIGEILAVLPSSIDVSNAGVPNSDDVPVVIAVEAGSELDQGDRNEARWVFLGYSDDIEPTFPDFGGDPDIRTMAILSEPAIRLLDNTIAWALGQEPQSVEDWSVR
jgi:hypothetical protein